MSCHDIREQTVPYLELDLDADRVHEITVHLESCEPCRREMESVRQVLVRLKGQAVPDPGQRFWNEFPFAVRRGLRAAQSAEERPARSANIARWRSSWSMAIAASVMLLVGAWLVVEYQAVDFSKTHPSILKGEATRTGHGIEVPDLAEADWDKTWDEDDPDMSLVDLASGLDPGTVDRLFKDI